MYISRPPSWFKIPIVLVQWVDAIPLLLHIVDNQRDGYIEPVRFGIALSNKTIPETKVF